VGDFYSTLRAPHRGNSLGPFVCGAKYATLARHSWRTAGLLCQHKKTKIRGPYALVFQFSADYSQHQQKRLTKRVIPNSARGPYKNRSNWHLVLRAVYTPSTRVAKRLHPHRFRVRFGVMCPQDQALLGLILNSTNSNPYGKIPMLPVELRARALRASQSVKGGGSDWASECPFAFRLFFKKNLCVPCGLSCYSVLTFGCCGSWGVAVGEFLLATHTNGQRDEPRCSESMNTASKLGSHTQTDGGTWHGVGL
jgi:hypothetical protein